MREYSLLFILIGLFCVFIIYRNVRKNIFSEKESIIWMLGAILMMVAPFFTKTLNRISELAGIDYPPSLLFLILFVFTFLLIFRLTQKLHILSEQLKEISQIGAINTKRIADLEERLDRMTQADDRRSLLKGEAEAR